MDTVKIYATIYKDVICLLSKEEEPSDEKRFWRNFSAFFSIDLIIDPKIVLERISQDDFDNEDDYLRFTNKIHLIMNKSYKNSDEITDPDKELQKILTGVLMHCNKKPPL